MGTKQHTPPHDNRPFAGGPHDEGKKAPGPGVRPGTRSRLLEARERLEKK